MALRDKEREDEYKCFVLYYLMQARHYRKLGAFELTWLERIWGS